MELGQVQFRKILNIGISLTTEKDRHKLLEKILVESMNITSADAGTLYVLEENALVFKVMKTLSMGISRGENGETIDLPPVPLEEQNVCAYSAIHRKPIRIRDVWNNDTFDFSGPKKYDGLTGYHTESMMVIPLANHEGEVIGVMQLINALNEKGEIIAFDPEYEFIILSLASQAAITLSDMRYTEELKEQMWSFTEALATAIDERTPYNASHTRKVAHYAEKVAEYLEEEYQKGKFPEEFDTQRREQLVMGALLHDIGKMIVPLEVMNKPTRLGTRLEEIRERFKLFQSYCLIRKLQGKINEEEWEQEQQYLCDTLQFIEEINGKGFLPDGDVEHLKQLKGKICETPEGEKRSYFTEEEWECLNIRKGTLTEKERKIMESHVVMTGKILSKVHFNRYFKDCTRWAVSHHECLNGSGYPEGLTEKDLPLESRILAVTDVYDALTSKDRPYKEAMPKEKAFAILDAMVAEGKLDGRIVEALKQIEK